MPTRIECPGELLLHFLPSFRSLTYKRISKSNNRSNVSVCCCYYCGKGRPSKIGNIACSRWMGYDLRIKNEVSFTSKLRPLFINYKFHVFKSKIQMMWVRKSAFSCLQCKFQFQYYFNPTNYPFTFALIIFSGSIHKMIIQ